MKEIEKALNEEYKETLGSITYRDKSRLYDLTSNGTRHAPTVGRIIIKRTIALAVCIAVLATGTTALAFTNPVVRSAMEEFIRARTSTDLSDKMLRTWRKGSKTYTQRLPICRTTDLQI